MTPADRRTEDRRALDMPPLRVPSWAWPLVLAALMGLGAARVTLGGKEDASAHRADLAEAQRLHTADYVKQQGQMDSMRFNAEKVAVRDSAWKADAMRILLDVQRQVKR